MYWLNNDEKRVAAGFFAEQYAGACVVRNTDDGAREVLPYAPERTSALAAEVVNCLDGVSVELTAFVRNMNETMGWELGRVYVAWYGGDGPLVGTFYLSGADGDPAIDCTIQASMLAGGEKPAELLDVHDLGEWVVGQIVDAIESEQFDGDVELLFNNISKKLSTL